VKRRYLVLAAVVAVALYLSTYTVSETEHLIVTDFGRVICAVIW
jgi:hypothetical protein